MLMARGDAREALPWLEQAQRLRFSDPRLLPALEEARRRTTGD
jgi:hypothetical protein